MNKQSGTTAFILSLVMGFTTGVATQAKANETLPPRQILKGNVETFGALTEQIQADIGVKCLKDSSGVIRVSHVQAGREACYGGVQEGDKILGAKITGNELQIGIERQGHPYLIKLRTLAAGQTAKATLSCAQNQSPPAGLTGKATSDNLLGADLKTLLKAYALEPTKVKTLAKYNMEIIMDRSLSMRAKDCPLNLSRWDWCGAQASEIAKALDPYTKNGLTLIPFNKGFDVYEHATPQNIVNVFEDHGFKLGTYLYEPLAQRFDEFFNRRTNNQKPLLILVITDGEPWPDPESNQVRAELVDASKRMRNEGEVSVVFLQIGDNDIPGRNYLLDLGNNLVQEGSRFQYVHTVTFDELKEKGIAKSVVAVVENYSQNGPVAAKAATKVSQ